MHVQFPRPTPAVSRWLPLRFQMIIHECHQPTSAANWPPGPAAAPPNCQQYPLFLSTSSAGQTVPANQTEIPEQNSDPPDSQCQDVSAPRLGSNTTLFYDCTSPWPVTQCHMVPAMGVGTGTAFSLRGPGSTPGKDLTWGTGCSIAKAGKPSGAHQNFPLSYSDAPPPSMAGSIGWPGHRKISDL